MGAGGGGGEGRRHRPGHPAGGHGGRRRRLLPDPQPGGRGRLRGGGPQGGHLFHRSRRGCGRRAHRLPGRPDPPGDRPRGAVPPPAVARRGGPHPARGGRAGGGAAGGRDHRLGVGVVRDAPLPDRAAAGDGHPPMGRQPGPAGGGQGRVEIPGGSGPAPPRPQPQLRHRRTRRAHLPPDDAALRGGGGPAPPAGGRRPRPVAQPVVPLGGPGHARAQRHRPAAGGIATP